MRRRSIGRGSPPNTCGISSSRSQRTCPAAARLIERLKGLQDKFGDVHDAHVFLPTLRTALAETVHDRRAELGEGLRRLVISLRARASDAFGSAAGEWLEPGRRASFLQEVSLAGQALTARVRRGRLTPHHHRLGPEVTVTAS